MRGHMTNAEILMVVFTAVIAVTGVIGAIIFNGQLATMTAQLDEMKILSTLTKESITAANRAWIAPTAATLGKPLEDGLPARIQIRIVNVGREPALGLVWKVASILVPYIAPENGADANTENIGPNVVCHGLGPRQADGLVIYPPGGGDYWLPFEIPDTPENKRIVDSVVKREGSLVIQGCFAYRAAGERRTSSFQFFLRDVPNQPSPNWRFNATLTGNEAT